jgi:DNA-binding NarL/FixJ family response regulator
MPSLAALRPSPLCRVVIIDDHVAIVEMIRQVIDSMPQYQVVGVAAEAAAALELCRREQPDLIVLDLVMPPTSGLALMLELRAACGGAKVMIFSGHLPAAAIQRALAAGAHGLVEKTAPLGEFREALQAVGSGQVYFSRAASEAIRQLVNLKPPRAVRGVRLTEREKTVMQGIARGLSSKEISAELSLSVHTVVNHRTRLMKKTGLRGVAQLSRYAVQLGLVEDLEGPGYGLAGL